ncbi:hypothetical protein SAMN04515648_2087 [Phyllobacterium sp. CL33Tsu]|nr:hypothetical protein SAMN04515648_2087 [Phyllobacterium sp. CL33Tsu]
MSRTRKTARARDAFRMNWVFGQIVPVIIDVPEIALIGVAVLLMRAMLTTYPKVVTRHIALMTVRFEVWRGGLRRLPFFISFAECTRCYFRTCKRKKGPSFATGRSVQTISQRGIKGLWPSFSPYWEQVLPRKTWFAVIFESIPTTYGDPGTDVCDNLVGCLGRICQRF